MNKRLTPYGIEPNPNKQKIQNWVETRKATGRFEDQLGGGQMERGLGTMNSAIIVSRKEYENSGYGDMSDANGAYGAQDNIYFSDPGFFQGSKSSTEKHELSHAFDVGTIGAFDANVESNIQKKIKSIPVKGGFKTEDWMPAPEVYAELMKFRLENNINPKKIFTKQDLPELRKKLKKEDDYGMFNINDMYDDQNILRLMNEVVTTDKPNDPNTRVV